MERKAIMSNCKSCSKYKKNEYTGFSICTGESCEILVRKAAIKDFAGWLYKKRYILTEDNPTYAYYPPRDLDDVISMYEKEKEE